MLDQKIIYLVIIKPNEGIMNGVTTPRGLDPTDFQDHKMHNMNTIGIMEHNITGFRTNPKEHHGEHKMNTTETIIHHITDQKMNHKVTQIIHTDFGHVTDAIQKTITPLLFAINAEPADQTQGVQDVPFTKMQTIQWRNVVCLVAFAKGEVHIWARVVLGKKP